MRDLRVTWQSKNNFQKSGPTVHLASDILLQKARLSAKDGDQNKLETETLLFTRNNKRSGAFCTAFIAEMDAFFPLLSHILRPFGEWIKADFYHVLKFEHRSMIREVGTKDSHQRNVLKCGEKVGTSKLF